MPSIDSSILVRSIVNVLLSVLGGYLLKVGIAQADANYVISAVVIGVATLAENLWHRTALANEYPPPPSATTNQAGLNVFAGPAQPQRASRFVGFPRLAMVVGAILLAGMMGCEADSTQRIVSAEDSLASAETALMAAHGAGLVSTAQVKAVQPYADAATAALFAAEKANASGDTKAVGQLLAGAGAAITEIANVKSSPTTQP